MLVITVLGVAGAFSASAQTDVIRIDALNDLYASQALLNPEVGCKLLNLYVTVDASGVATSGGDLILLVRDAGGKIISNPADVSLTNVFPLGDIFFDTSPTSRPWTITLYDSQFTNPGPTPVPIEVLVTRPVVATKTFDPVQYVPICASLPYIGDIEESVNPDLGDLIAQVFEVEDANGDPALHIYEINDESEGEFALAITLDDIAPYIDNPPAANTEIKSSASGKVTLYVLTTGELQINIGPDADGNVHVVIFSGLPPTNVYGYSFNVNDIVGDDIPG
jgi:hypothetical protein